MIQTSSPAPLLHLSCTSPDLSCTPPAPLLTPAAPLFPAPLQQKLDGFPKDTSNHFKTNAKLCKAFFVLLYRAIRCDYVLGLHGTYPDLSCTSPAPLLTPAAPFFAAPLQQKLEGAAFDTKSFCGKTMEYYGIVSSS